MKLRKKEIDLLLFSVKHVGWHTYEPTGLRDALLSLAERGLLTLSPTTRQFKRTDSGVRTVLQLCPNKPLAELLGKPV